MTTKPRERAGEPGLRIGVGPGGLPPSLLQVGLNPGCERIGGDGQPGTPHGPAILPGQPGEVVGALGTDFSPPATLGGALSPSALFCAVFAGTPGIVVRPRPHHCGP